MMCIRCNKRPAIVFVQKMENGEQKSEGYCLSCAREIGIKPVDDLMKQFGISEQDLLNPCTNLAVGAWLMKRHQINYGNTWEAVGVYHSATPSYKWKYAQKIQESLDRLVQKHPPAQGLSAGGR